MISMLKFSNVLARTCLTLLISSSILSHSDVEIGITLILKSRENGEDLPESYLYRRKHQVFQCQLKA